MAPTLKKLAPPSADKRWKMVEITMRKNGYEPDALIEALHEVQSCFGYLDRDALRYVARSLNVPLSKVYGVATFYHYFTLKPQGEHTCVVCTGTACYIKGAAEIVDTIHKEFGIRPGETTRDGKLSLLTARCIGACGIGPAAVLDSEVVGHLTADAIIGRIRRWMNDKG